MMISPPLGVECGGSELDARGVTVAYYIQRSYDAAWGVYQKAGLKQSTFFCFFGIDHRCAAATNKYHAAKACYAFR